MKSTFLLSFAAVGLFALAGCENKCVTLESKICTDLGPSDCALWKEKGARDMLIPKTRTGAGFSKGCDVLLDSYPVIIDAQKKIVANYKAAAAALKKT